MNDKKGKNVINDKEVSEYKQQWRMFQEAHNGFEHYLIYLLKGLESELSKQVDIIKKLKAARND